MAIGERQWLGSGWRRGGGWEQRRPATAWRTETVLRLAARVFLSLAAGTLLVGICHHLLPAEPNADRDLAMFVIGLASLHGAGLVWVGRFLRENEATWAGAFGLGRPLGMRGVAWAVGTGVLLVLMVQPLSWMVSRTLEWCGLETELQSAVSILQGADTWGRRIFYSLSAIVAVPVAEEVLFRGVLYAWLRQCGWVGLAWLASALLFALVHMNLLAFLPLLAVAVALTWLYERTGNLQAPILAHAVFNAMNVAGVFLLGGEGGQRIGP